MYKFNSKKTGLILISLIPLGYILKEVFSYLPDLTLVFYLLLYILSFFVTVIKKQGFYLKRIDSLFYIWIILMIVGIFLSPTPFNGLFKLAKFIFLGLSIIFFARLFINDRNDFNILLKYLLGLSFFTEIIILVDFIRSGASIGRYLSFGSVNPIPLAMLGVITTAIVLVLYLYKKIRTRLFLIILFPSIAIIVISGSKGPIISLLISLILISPILIKRLNFKTLSFIVIGVFALTRIPFINQAFDILLYRFSNIGNDISTSIRLDMYHESLSVIKNNPILGGGTGSLPNYPHNFFIEVLAENGIITMLIVTILLSAFMLQFLIFLRKRLKDYLATCINVIFIISFISLMFSFSYVDHKYMFLSIALLISYNQFGYPNDKVLSIEKKVNHNEYESKLAI